MAKKYTGKELQKQQRRIIAAQRAINKKLGITLTQSDIKAIGEILTFVDSQNYFGDVYKDKREEQIKAAEWWTNLFFMNDKDYKKNKTDIQEIMDKVIKTNLDKANEIKNFLII